MSSKKKFFTARNIVITAVAAALIGAAIAEQLRLPPENRTWHGTIAGMPYDFRMPTVDRFLATFWNRNNPNLFVPRMFGVGWDINLYPLLHPSQNL